MEWKDEYSIGVHEIDQHYMQLVRVISDFNDSISEHSSTLNRDMGRILGFLVKYTHYHFASEEAFMTRINYPDISAHKQAHINLVEQLKEVLEKLKTYQSYKPIQFYYFLMKWLTDHIVGEDQKIGEYLSSKKDRLIPAVKTLQAPQDLMESIQYNMKKLTLMINNKLINEEEKNIKKMDYLQRLYNSLHIHDLSTLNTTLESVSILIDKKYINEEEEKMLKQMIIRRMDLDTLIKSEKHKEICLKSLDAFLAQGLIDQDYYDKSANEYREAVN